MLNLLPTNMLLNVTGAEGPWLSSLVAVPALVAALILFVPAVRAKGRQVALVASTLMLVGFVALAFLFDWSAASTTQMVESYSWIKPAGISWALGLNALGLVMLLLTASLVPLVLVLAKKEDSNPEDAGRYAGLLMLLYSFIVIIFAAFDLVVFYIAFEGMLIPLFFLIGKYGNGENKQKAAVKFLIYSLAGGLVMLGGIVAVFSQLGAVDGKAFRYDTLAQVLPNLSVGWQLAVFIPLFIAFAIKAPLVPVHTWLPETAASARPGTSVLLVGILDKVGTYGMIVFLVFMLPQASLAARGTIIVLAVISILWGGFAANGQKDLLRLVAFTSISHFGFIILGIFIGSQLALTGSMVFMVAHGLSIAALFFISGLLIERGGTASVHGYGGMQRVTPVIAGTWLFAGMASISLPGLSGFIPEYMVLMGSFQVSPAVAIFSVFGVILAAMYILLPYQRIFTGRSRPEQRDLPDLGTSEKLALAPILVAMLVLGIYANPLTASMDQIAEDFVLPVQWSTETVDEGGSALVVDLPSEGNAL